MQVRVELISWVSSLVDGPGTGSYEITETIPASVTLRELLRTVSARFPRLNAVLWDEHDRNALGPHLEIIVNETILDARHTLDAPLQEGDRITLTGQYIGG